MGVTFVQKQLQLVARSVALSAKDVAALHPGYETLPRCSA